MADDFDPLSKQFLSSANDVFGVHRSEKRAIRHGNSLWPLISIFDYPTIRAALCDWETWSSVMPAVEELILGDAAIMIQDDPPRHTALRALISPWLRSEALSEINVDIHAIARRIVTSHIGQSVEFSETIAAQIALEVICQIIGIPSTDQSYLRDWTNRLSHAVGLEFLETDEALLLKQKKEVGSLHTELSDYVRSLICRGEKNEGLLGVSSDWPLSLDERVGMLKSLAFAGNHTSAILQTNAIWLLWSNPSQYSSFKDGKVSIECAVDEIVRYKGTFRGITRRATKSGMIHGVEYSSGDYLLAWLTSANHDCDIFSNAATLDLSRRPNPHLAFAVGPHFCVGAQIARLELVTMLKVVRDLIPSIEIQADPAPINDPWVDGFQGLMVKLG